MFFIFALLLLVHHIEWTLELDIAGWHQMQIDCGCLYGIVAKQLADGIEIVTFIEEMGGKTVAIMGSSP